jgi:hypothetical protein
VLFSLSDDGIAKDYIPYRAKNGVKLEDYMDRFRQFACAIFIDPLQDSR